MSQTPSHSIQVSIWLIHGALWHSQVIREDHSLGNLENILLSINRPTWLGRYGFRSGGLGVLGSCLGAQFLWFPDLTLASCSLRVCISLSFPLFMGGERSHQKDLKLLLGAAVWVCGTWPQRSFSACGYLWGTCPFCGTGEADGFWSEKASENKVSPRPRKDYGCGEVCMHACANASIIEHVHHDTGEYV